MTPTLPQMIAANNRAVRRARFMRRLDRAWLFVSAAVLAVIVAAIFSSAIALQVATLAAPQIPAGW